MKHLFHIAGECEDCCNFSEALRTGYTPQSQEGDCGNAYCVNYKRLHQVPDDPTTLPEIYAATITKPDMDAADFLRRALDLIDQGIDEHKDDAVALAKTVAFFRDVKQDIAAAETSAQAALWKAMGDEREIHGEHIGYVHKDYGKSRKAWDHEDVWTRLVNVAYVNAYDDEGEIVPLDIVVGRTIDLVHSVVTQAGYKVDGLRSIGLEPDEVSEVTFGKRSIVISPTPLPTAKPKQIEKAKDA